MSHNGERKDKTEFTFNEIEYKTINYAFIVMIIYDL
jgi:hypothetical protein